MKQLKVLIDNIDSEQGIKNNILPSVRRIELVLKSRFPDLDIKYYPSYFVDRIEGKWVYPIVISSLGYMHWLFQYQANINDDEIPHNDIFSLIPKKVRESYNKGNGIILVFIFEPFPLNSSIENFKDILESSPIYKNIRICSLHYVDCVNFIPGAAATHHLDNFSSVSRKHIPGETREQWKARKNLPKYLGGESNRRFCCFLMNYQESEERKKLLLFFKETDMLSKGFITAKNKGKEITQDKANLIFEDLDIEDTLSRVSLNIIPEGDFNSSGIPFVSEKIYRCFKYKKPFIFIGRQGTLDYLRNIGYKTFDPIINEAYDNIENPNKRLIHIFKEINRLINNDSFDAHMEQLQNICEHNYNLYNRITEETNKKLYRDITNEQYI